MGIGSMRLFLSLPWAAALAACAAIPPAPDPYAQPAPGADVPSGPAAPAPTHVLDRDTAFRLRNNSGITLQWIGWDERGQVQVAEGDDGVWRLSGRQRGGGGSVSVQGVVSEIGSDYFLLDGTVRIENAPNRGRLCERDKVWRFAVTQNRKYWRLREFEWCDHLTDYIDIYF